MAVFSLNQDLNDYAVIFEDSSPSRPQCNSTAANALTAKIRNTLTTGPQSNFGSPVDPYQQWLNGASVSFIFAAATRLANEGVLDFQLDQELQQVRDNFRNSFDPVRGLKSKDPGCGIEATKRVSGNSCMDDYTVAATGFAWIAAYEHKWGRTTDPFVSYTHAMLDRALSTDESICIVDPAIDDGQPHGVDSQNFCKPLTPAVYDNLKNGPYKVVSLNHGGESLGYGIGLMASVSSAMAGLNAAGALGDPQQFFSEQQKVIARAIFEEAQSKAQANGGVFLDLCWTFIAVMNGPNPVLDPNGNPEFTVTHGLPCDDRAGNPLNTNLYTPTMFPVAAFYNAFIFGPTIQPRTTGYGFGFSSGFAANFTTDFFGAGRRIFYGEMGWDAQNRLDIEFINARMQEREGYFENLDCNNLSGWAWEQTQPNTPISVDIYQVTGTRTFAPTLSPVATGIMANLPRQDLVNAHKGNGVHAFNFPIPSVFQDGSQHSLQVTYGGTTVPLFGSPRILSCAVPPPALQGVHDTTNCDRIDGFAEDITQPDNPVDVNIYHPVISHFTRQEVMELIATVSANLGSDMVPATAGKGNHGFLQFVPNFIKDGTSQRIHIEFTNNNSLLLNTDRILNTQACQVSQPPGPYEGYMDSVNCSRMDGWVWNPPPQGQPCDTGAFATSPVDVEILVDGTRRATLTANLFGPDLLQACKGNGNHRFAWYIPAYLKDGAAHNYSVRVRGETATLPFSTPTASGTIACSVPPQQPPPQPSSFNTPAGGGITVSAPAASGQAPYAEVTFDNVQVPGNTTFVPIDPAFAGTMPSGYAWPSAPIQPMMMEIATTAVFSGNVTVKVRTPAEQDPSEFAQLRVMHMESGQYADRTVLPPSTPAPDFNSRTFQARVTSFSPFMIVRELLPVTLTGTPQALSITYGQSIGITAQLASGISTPAPSGTITLREGGTIVQTASVYGAGGFSFTASNLSAGIHTFTVTYSGDSQFQQGISAPFNVTVNPAPLTATANSASRRYGDPNPAFTGAISGLVNGDTITAAYSTTAAPSAKVGTFPITPVLSDPGNRVGNYTVTLQNGTLTITPAPLLVAANNKTRLYGYASPALDGTVSGLLFGDTLDEVQIQYSTTATAQSAPGSYTITTSFFDPKKKMKNYTVTLQNATLTILPLPTPLPPNPVYPSDGLLHAPSSFILRWSDGLDASRRNPLWPVTYAIYYKSWAYGAAEPASYVLFSTGLQCNPDAGGSCTMPVPSVGNGNYRWYVVASMDVSASTGVPNSILSTQGNAGFFTVGQP